jgi:hypothetical protein
LSTADIAPKTNSLDRRETGLKAELSAIGSLKSVLSDLDKSLTDLKDGSAFDLMSIAAPASVDILQTGSPSVGQYSIEVDAIAASQVLATSGFRFVVYCCRVGDIQHIGWYSHLRGRCDQRVIYRFYRGIWQDGHDHA